MQDMEALKTACDYVDDMQKFGYNHDFTEISFNHGQKVYNRIFKTLSESQLPNPENFKYSSLTLEELKEYLLTILTKILGPNYYNQIVEYNKMLKLEKRQNPFDATLETKYQNGIWIPSCFHISKDLATIEVISTAHEYIHGLLSKYMTTNYNSVLTNIHYKEFLSILVEYITCYILSTIMPQEKLEYKQRVNRLYAEHLMTLESLETKKLAILLRQLPSTRPDVILFQKYVTFDEHKTYGYIISNIFSNRLLELYFEDEQNLLKFIRNILAGEKSIKDLIKYYNLSLSKEETTKPYQELVKSLIIS